MFLLIIQISHNFSSSECLKVQGQTRGRPEPWCLFNEAGGLFLRNPLKKKSLHLSEAILCPSTLLQNEMKVCRIFSTQGR